MPLHGSLCRRRPRRRQRRHQGLNLPVRRHWWLSRLWGTRPVTLLSQNQFLLQQQQQQVLRRCGVAAAAALTQAITNQGAPQRRRQTFQSRQCNLWRTRTVTLQLPPPHQVLLFPKQQMLHRCGVVVVAAAALTQATTTQGAPQRRRRPTCQGYRLVTPPPPNIPRTPTRLPSHPGQLLHGFPAAPRGHLHLLLLHHHLPRDPILRWQ